MKFAVMTANAELDALRDMAQTADELGFSLLTFPDHLAYENADGALDPQRIAYSSMICAAMVSESTKRLRFGQLVTNNLLRHPAVTAQDFMSLDRLSHGRLIVGIGAAWRELEFKMAGMPYPELSKRMEMLDESLTCMRSLWTHEKTNFTGEYYSFNEAVLWPKPVQKPHPSILLGGFAPKLMRLAAKHADYVNIFFPMGKSGYPKMKALTNDAYREKVFYLREHTEKAGRPRSAVKVVNLLTVTVISDSTDVVENARKQMASIWGRSGRGSEVTSRADRFTPGMCRRVQTSAGRLGNRYLHVCQHPSGSAADLERWTAPLSLAPGTATLGIAPITLMYQGNNHESFPSI